MNSRVVQERYDNLMEAIGDFEESLNRLSSKDRQELSREFDERGIPVLLEYANMEMESMLVFKMSEDAFRRMEYYLGWEYERNNIEMKLQVADTIYVGYTSDIGRPQALMDAILEVVNDEE
jgi:hypothetical protein